MMATEKRLLIDLQGVNMDEVDTSDCTDVEDILSAVITYLSEQPVVDAVEVVHGRWVDEFKGKYANPKYICSNCTLQALKKEKMDELGNWHTEQALTDYCPNCGAKMDGDG